MQPNLCVMEWLVKLAACERQARVGEARPYLMPADHWGNHATGRVLTELYGKEPVLGRGGGTLPITALFRDVLGAYTVTFSFSARDERSHAPDEFYRLASFERGQRAYCRLIEELGEQSVC